MATQEEIDLIKETMQTCSKEELLELLELPGLDDDPEWYSLVHQFIKARFGKDDTTH